MIDHKISSLIINKYNKPVPRYTSYPTILSWYNGLDVAVWQQVFKTQFNIQNSTKGISLYIHLPFCESMCTYCGCNKKITTNHKVEEEYLLAVAKEWTMYKKLMKDKPIIRELHLGGGTPTFFSAENIDRLLKNILTDVIIHPQHEFSIEGHPNNTTLAQLEVLYKWGFRRISYGVQDNDTEVQRIINRVQPIENVKRATDNARQTGFKSVNFDLIYGLPRQTLTSIEKTITEVIALRPDRIAFYGYAHVPWTSKGQRLFNESDLPAAAERVALYLKGKQLLLQAGYFDIGMDHFALPHDALYTARQNGTLHRNFMGYSVQHSGMLIGLGVSAISDAGTAYAQNEKTIHDYYTAINNNILPVKKGYLLSEEDLLFRQTIIDISCKGWTVFDEAQLPLLEAYSFSPLQKMASDGLVTFNKTGCKVTATGNYFTRNICSAFDLYLQRNTQLPLLATFSKAM